MTPRIIWTARRSPMAPAFTPYAFNRPEIKALRPMLGRILATYGLSAESPKLAIAQALRDHVARIMIHPHPPLHPDGYTANLTSLPPDAPTWAAFNAAMRVGNRINDENQWWGQFGWDAIRRINIQYGTLNVAEKTLADDGMYTEYAPGRWRWRSINTAKSTQCSYQHIVLAAFQAAYGIPATIMSTVGHDGHMAYIPELRQWIYDESTYNEYYSLPDSTRPLSPLELHYESLAGRHGTLQVRKRSGPQHDPEPYIKPIPGTDTTYFSGNPGHPRGMTVVGSFLRPGAPDGRTVATQVMTHNFGDGSLASQVFGSSSYLKTTADAVFPDLGVMITRWEVSSAGVSLALESQWPGAGVQRFERRVNGGAWTPLVLPGDTLSNGMGQIEYRAIDSEGFSGATALVST